MKFRTTVLAALLLALVGAYVYYFEYKKPQEKKSREEKEKAVFALDWDRLSGLKIENAHGIFVFEKQAAQQKPEEPSPGAAQQQEWRIREPVKADADSTGMNSLVSSLKGLQTQQVVAEVPEDPGVFGLKRPRLKVQVLLKEGESPPPLLIGDKSPVGQNSYAMREGESKVLLLSSNLETQLDKPLIDFREKRLFTFKREDAEQLRIYRKGERSLELEREGAGWKIRYPIEARASETEVNELLNKLTTLRAHSFAEEEAQDLKAYGLSDPQWKVEVALAPDHALATLLLGEARGGEEKTGTIYAKRAERPAVVTLQSDLTQTLEREPEEFREKKVFPFNTWEVAKAELEWKGQKATLVKAEGNRWRITDPIQARADSGKVSSLLTTLSRLEADSFIEAPATDSGLADYGLADPIAKMTLHKEAEREEPQEEGEEKEEQPEGQAEEGFFKLGTLLLGKVTADGTEKWFAAVEGVGTVFSVPSDPLRSELPGDVEELRDHKLLSFYRYQVDSLESRGPAGTFALARKGEGWEIEKGGSGKAEDKSVNQLLDLLSGLEVRRYAEAAPADLSGYGLAIPEYRISIRQEQETGGDETLGVLLLADRGPEGEPDLVYTMEEGDGWIGLMAKDTKDKLVQALAPFAPKP
ncbi:MAG: DUF4340 domain-containing protein [bacterium]